MVGRPDVRNGLNDSQSNTEKKQQKRKHSIADVRSIARPIYKRNSAEHSDTHTYVYAAQPTPTLKPIPLEWK